ncbi:hypothetical protein EMEDMD4_490023 [Sinorhizobium medicae]|uniref:Uncharacterized protein n=1 Tax=Sinorhizobium medicae TaxID=110321 RepID=A0A508X0E8_9HYPH|nr:hypothetical protein EMEDMD4_490023 [Sinorhizobium medicae]
MRPHDLSQNIVNALSLNLRVKRVPPSLAEVLRGSPSKQANLRVVRYEIPFNRDEKRRSGRGPGNSLLQMAMAVYQPIRPS